MGWQPTEDSVVIADEGHRPNRDKYSGFLLEAAQQFVEGAVVERAQLGAQPHGQATSSSIITFLPISFFGIMILSSPSLRIALTLSGLSSEKRTLVGHVQTVPGTSRNPATDHRGMPRTKPRWDYSRYVPRQGARGSWIEADVTSRSKRHVNSQTNRHVRFAACAFLNLALYVSSQAFLQQRQRPRSHREGHGG